MQFHIIPFKNNVHEIVFILLIKKVERSPANRKRGYRSYSHAIIRRSFAPAKKIGLLAKIKEEVAACAA